MLFLAPDLGALGYLAGRRAGALTYNLTHTEIGPLLLVAFGLTMTPELLPVAIIWLAHIGFDRLLGYGLKYPSSFHRTHLGEIGRKPQPATEIQSG